MSHLSEMARLHADKTACLVYPAGRRLTYAELDRNANKVSQLLATHGLSQGDGIAILLDNDLTYFELAYGARELGLYYTPVSTHLKVDEALYIVDDCGAKALFIDARFTDVIDALARADDARCSVFVVNGTHPGCLSYDAEIARFGSYASLPDGPVGKDFFYSSGTTGRPKGIKQPLFTDMRQAKASGDWVRENFRFDQTSIYLSPAPLYHGAPLRFTMRTLDLGGTVVLIRKFDAELCLRAIAEERVTHSQWVPTMFFRLLALPPGVRDAYDLSSHRCAIHAAAPCPPEIKERMIEWWGPIVWEYYAGSERNGGTCISTRDWLAHRGSVGRAVFGKLHILDEDQNEVPAGVIGDVYFEGPEFIYHNDSEKTARSRNAKGWSTIGDIGYVDEDGFLYLTDRRAHMIISGGVNIYPAEIENTLSLHPDVRDVAVFGVPNAEFGEEVKAVVQLHDPAKASAPLAQDLIAFCRTRISGVKCPKSIDFEVDMPRGENGKLFKHVLKRRYVEAAASS